mmetsp:Transcript_41834/g.120887  ORF Transcript_41834/g.120887 Transcript_41834/m.120887 type:complete len:209 (+) Transcript_41834:1756-2382(+)
MWCAHGEKLCRMPARSWGRLVPQRLRVGLRRLRKPGQVSGESAAQQGCGALLLGHSRVELSGLLRRLGCQRPAALPVRLVGVEREPAVFLGRQRPHLPRKRQVHRCEAQESGVQRVRGGGAVGGDRALRPAGDDIVPRRGEEVWSDRGHAGPLRRCVTRSGGWAAAIAGDIRRLACTLAFRRCAGGTAPQGDGTRDPHCEASGGSFAG